MLEDLVGCQHHGICNCPSKWLMVDGYLFFHYSQYPVIYLLPPKPQLSVGKHEVPVPKCPLGGGPVLGAPHLSLQSPGLTAHR